MFDYQTMEIEREKHSGEKPLLVGKDPPENPTTLIVNKKADCVFAFSSWANYSKPPRVGATYISSATQFLDGKAVSKSSSK